MKKNIALSDTGFLFNPSTGDSFSTNPSGLDIIRWLKEGKSDKEVLKNLIDKYEVDPDKAERDLQDFMDMLKNYHLSEHE
jgi:hypothetical protein